MSENDDIVSTCGNQFRLLEEHESIQSMNIANSPQYSSRNGTGRVGSENFNENSIVQQLGHGRNSVTFYDHDDLIDELSQNEDQNLKRSVENVAFTQSSNISGLHSGDLMQDDEHETDKIQLVFGNQSFTCNDVDDLIEYAESSDNDEFNNPNSMECNDLIELNPESEHSDFGDDDESNVANTLFNANIADVLENDVLNDELSEAEDAPVTYQGRPKRGRKRKVPEQSRADRKKLYNTNKAHVNTKGNLVEEKFFDGMFVCSCSKKCTEIVSEERRERLFNQFWSMGTFSGRCAILINCVSQVPTKRSYTKNPIKKRLKTRKYTMFGRAVCKVALLQTLQISQKRIAVALDKQEFFNSFEDCRGKASGGANAFPVSTRVAVRAHISSFPKYISHYTRSQTNAKFLNSNLNLAKMYQLYRADTDDPVSKSFYKRVFYEDFNLRFKAPKKDSCLKCDIYAVKIQNILLSENDRLNLEMEHNDHLEQAELLRKQMNDDIARAKVDSLLEVLPFDFQKILCLPNIATSIAYYLRQLNCYNFGIHVGSSGRGIFNVWIETEASKGTQEVGSCLRKHINNINGPKTLILWSDACGGQNRSIKLILMLIHILQNHKSLETISMRYLQSGHSFLPNDSEFGDFECALKKANGVFTDVGYMEIMQECRITNKFTVNRMSGGDFFSVKNLEKEITNRKVDINKKKINWLETHEIVLEKSQPGIIKMKKKIDGEFQCVNIEKRGGNISDFGKIDLDLLWPDGKALSKEKIENLKEILKLVPEEHKQFYSFLDLVTTGDFEDDIDGFGETTDFVLEF